MPKSYRIGVLIMCLFSFTIILFLLPSFFAAPENLEEQEDNSGSFARLIVSNVSQSTASPPLHRSRSRSRLRVAVVTVIDCPSPTSSSRFARFFNATYKKVVVNRFEYCRAHDCEVVLAATSCGQPRGHQSHAAYGKISTALDLVRTMRYSWILVLDYDTLIMNQTIDIVNDVLVPELGRPSIDASLVETVNTKDLILTRDFNGLNTGVFLLRGRGSSWSAGFLKKVIDPPRHCRFAGPWWEQSRIQCLLNDKENLSDSWKVHVASSQRRMNSYPRPYDFGKQSASYVHGDFVAHLAGATNDVKFPIDDALKVFEDLASSTKSKNSSDDDAVLRKERRFLSDMILMRYSRLESISG